MRPVEYDTTRTRTVPQSIEESAYGMARYRITKRAFFSDQAACPSSFPPPALTAKSPSIGPTDALRQCQSCPHVFISHLHSEGALSYGPRSQLSMARTPFVSKREVLWYQLPLVKGHVEHLQLPFPRLRIRHEGSSSVPRFPRPSTSAISMHS